MPVFNDSENKVLHVPEGDYTFCTVEFESKISSGGKTAGSDMFLLTLELEGPGKRVLVFENLIDHQSCAWKIDTYLKSCGIKLAKGEAFEFRKDVAEQKGVRWINPLGLRGTAKFTSIEDTYNGRKTTKNKVACFYTDKPKLEPRVIEVAEEDEPF